ncbi:MAG: ferritin family protein [Candidatus Marinimicrobia bacterium]|jgi:rubrerythrin|nr:ferritin family protein [Candidatus Neomarinimicrobiota bacterium]
MYKTNFEEIINFAIEREKEAVEFYQNLQTKVRFKNQKNMLKDLEKMEEGHIKILKNLRQKKLKDLKLKEVLDLKISNYLVEKEPTEDMDFQDILIVAMKREEASTNLYKDLSTKVDAETKKLFLKLAQEEAGHKLQFETLYDEHVLREN